MARIRFFPADQEIEITTGTTILEAARTAGLVIESPCNGNGTCGKCKVKLISGTREHVRGGELTPEEPDAVLACLAKVYSDVEVELAAGHDSHNIQILTHGHSWRHIEREPLIRKNFDEQADLTRIYAGAVLLGTEIGNTIEQNYGVALDIGTTTLVLSILDLNTGREDASVSALNPQSRHAQDVLSRIKFASDEEGLHFMYDLLIEAINKLLHEAVDKAGIHTGAIYEIVFSGNTCMLHLATKVNPRPLGMYPYTPQIQGGNVLNAADHHLDIASFGLIYLPPIFSAYVGADITSGILAAELWKLAGITLFIDIGTNGEMVLAVDGKMVTCSTAAGPAFEGMNIACGMRAAPGAVEKFEIADGECMVKTIGNLEAVGICGSGLLDIVGELVAHKFIGQNGKFIDPLQAEDSGLAGRCSKQEGKVIFKVTDTVYLSQKDVRQVQLAKGAIRAGIEAMLAHQGILAAAVGRVFIAGSFGYHLNVNSLINIGLLPEAFRDKTEFLGNTSKTGGQIFLLNKQAREVMETLVKEVEVLELATTANFDKTFVRCLNF